MVDDVENNFSGEIVVIVNNRLKDFFREIIKNIENNKIFYILNYEEIFNKNGILKQTIFQNFRFLNYLFPLF